MIEDEIKQILVKNFKGDAVTVENQSHLHEGHQGNPGGGQTHFHLTIISDQFQNLSRVQRHQKINLLLEPLFEKGLHALSMTLKTNSEYIGI